MLTGALMGTGTANPAELGFGVVVLLPLVVSGLMAGLKVGELAAMLVSGSGIGRVRHDGARGPWRRACHRPFPHPRRPRMKRRRDAGHEYAVIWGETVEANRKLQTLATVLGGACLPLALVLLRIASAEPPRQCDLASLSWDDGTRAFTHACVDGHGDTPGTASVRIRP